MKFHFSTSSSPGYSEKFHKNLFDLSADDSSDERDTDSGSEYETEYDNWAEANRCATAKNHRLNGLSMPLTDTIAEFAQEISDDPFFVNDLSFIFELSRKRAISPYAIIVALMYLKRLKAKQTAGNSRGRRNQMRESTLDSYSSQQVIDSYFSSCRHEQKQDADSLDSLSNTELCLVSILLASKYLIDEGETEEIYNNEWAQAANITTAEINRLERLVLSKMEWELYVSSDEFWKFTNELTEK
jgi:hypothetical protein